MGVVTLPTGKPLTGGFYTVGEVARILGIDNEAKVRRWLDGSASRPAVLQRQYESGFANQELGFLDLMEIRFVDYFRRQDVSLQSIRKAADAARRELKTKHPFALSNVKFVTDRKRIFLHTAEQEHDNRLMDIVSGQHAMYDVIEAFLAKGVEFAPATGLAEHWKPKPKEYPAVVISPRLAHGQPAIEGKGIPTSALFQLWRAEDQDIERVADWFELDRADAEQAIEYELELAA
ncbi:DUF433 domain-containing protein [Nitratireductor sp. StC3]|uniref:DUF433 domain-containing protein n=1 Tax=Nitratireductor sp. StC3 TaxID=2126741 RepID=UPI000D0E00A7|nr:DUF433 domain-containing protein [Nitratireductor sp. StC3]PSM17794.1 hypothetical protein C7T96_12485 [Nitratireductor sp. StC3]